MHNCNTGNQNKGWASWENTATVCLIKLYLIIVCWMEFTAQHEVGEHRVDLPIKPLIAAFQFHQRWLISILFIQLC